MEKTIFIPPTVNDNSPVTLGSGRNDTEHRVLRQVYNLSGGTDLDTCLVYLHIKHNTHNE